MGGSVWVNLGDLVWSLAKTLLVGQGSVDHAQLSGVMAGHISVLPLGRLCVELAARYRLRRGPLRVGLLRPPLGPRAQSPAGRQALARALVPLSLGPLVFANYDQTLSRTETFRRDLCLRGRRRHCTSQCPRSSGLPGHSRPMPASGAPTSRPL